MSQHYPGVRRRSMPIKPELIFEKRFLPDCVELLTIWSQRIITVAGAITIKGTAVNIRSFIIYIPITESIFEPGQNYKRLDAFSG